VARLAAGHGRTPAQVIFRFGLQLGMICLTGTTNPAHLREDLAVSDFTLTDAEVEALETIAG
ncbi:MAG TPA: aldo/keto reductase, partial [Thermoanaerobaculia bacterium]|nr:aldo/keto reductase [Thermoanaerobaculia bacterium]